jgi:toxin HigB-1
MSRLDVIDKQVLAAPERQISPPDPNRARMSSPITCKPLPDMLDAATRLSDLRSPPRNQLEALKPDRVGQHSIRINRQWRLCFRWTPNGPEEVVIVDYH